MELTARFTEAMTFTALLHGDQFRKGTDVPYLSHLLAVAGSVIENGGSEDEAIAALLHDAIEDRADRLGGSENLLALIRRRFGVRVAEIVIGCSDSEAIPKPPWRERKERYLAHLAEADRSVLLVSAADKLHNARRILADYRQLGETLWPRFNAPGRDILWYYASLVEAYRGSSLSPRQLVEELAEVVTELARRMA